MNARAHIGTFCAVLMLAVIPLRSAQAQGEAVDLLGLVPADAVLAGQVHVGELLQQERLDALMAGLASALGDQGEPILAAFRAQYAEDIAPFATNVTSCMVYAQGYENNAPVTVCAGNFGEGGYAAPSLSEIEVIDGRYMVTGSRRAAVLDRVRSGELSGSATLGGVQLDPSLLAHFVVAIQSQLAEGMGLPLATSDLRYVEVRVAADESQMGGIQLEVRIMTASAEASQQVQSFIAAMLTSFAAELAEVPEVAGFVGDAQSWLTVDGTSVVLRPSTQGLVTLAAFALPTFGEYMNTAREGSGSQLPVMPAQ